MINANLNCEPWLRSHRDSGQFIAFQACVPLSARKIQLFWLQGPSYSHTLT
jgi:hypothetical protein